MTSMLFTSEGYRGKMEVSNIYKPRSAEKDSLAENLEMKRSVAEGSPSQVTVSPLRLSQVKG